MKSFFAKHAQGLAVGLIALVIGGGVVAAAPIPIYRTLTQGFIRVASEGLGYFRYGYGYGYIGQLFGYGYGYGYDLRDFSDYLRSVRMGEIVGNDPSKYGFLGHKGNASIISIESGYGIYSADGVEDYGFSISYETSYLAKTSILVYQSTGYYEDRGGKGYYTYESEPQVFFSEADFASGTRNFSSDGLACDIRYLVVVQAVDAGDNQWSGGRSEIVMPECTDHTATSTPETPGATTTATATPITTTGSYARGFMSRSNQAITRDQLPTPPINPKVPKPTALPISPVMRQGALGPGPKILQRALNYL